MLAHGPSTSNRRRVARSEELVGRPERVRRKGIIPSVTEPPERVFQDYSVGIAERRGVDGRRRHVGLEAKMRGFPSGRRLPAEFLPEITALFAIAGVLLWLLMWLRLI